MPTEISSEATPVAVGDIFECDWGYNQTNIDYYEVVAISKTGRVKLHAIAKRKCSDPYAPNVTVSPHRGVYLGEPTGYKVVGTGYDGTPWVNISSFSAACRIATVGNDLGAVSSTETGIGWGH